MWHLLAQYLSHFTKACGLLPFRIRFRDKIKVEMCPISLFYCCVHASVLAALSIFAVVVAIDSTADDKLTLTIIFLMSTIFSYCRNIDFYLFQIRKRHLYASTIEDITNLYDRLERLNQTTHRLFNPQFARICRIRLLGWSIQIVLMLSNIFMYKNTFAVDDENYQRRLIAISLEVYTNVVKTIFTNIYFGSMLLMLQFFYVINENIVEIMRKVGYVDLQGGRNKMSMQSYCNFSDRLDQMSDMFERVTRCLKIMIALFSVQLLMMFLDTFSIILYEVRICSFNLPIL